MTSLLALSFFCISLFAPVGSEIPSNVDLPVTDSTFTVDNELAKALQGAWSCTNLNDKGEEITMTRIIMDGYMSTAIYNEKTGDFIKTSGGHWTLDNKVLTFVVEYSSSDKSQVGTTVYSGISLKDDQLTFAGDNSLWKRIDHGKGSGLNGAWLITGRKRDGQLNRHTPGDRKTMKILSGTKFQWIAYNTATGEFFGTGGGTYTANDGTYNEQIEFFSRDKTRVGAELTFHFEILENEWHHSGLSSKGDPIYEIWSPRILAVKN